MSEAAGKPAFDFPPAVDDRDRPVPRERRATLMALSERRKIDGVYQYVRKDGSKFFATVTASPVIVGGRLVGSVTVFRDRTQWIQLDRSKSEFVSVASHQLRMPLTSMRWFLELLLGDKEGKLTKEQRENLEQILAIDKNMLDIVNGLLNVARLETGTYVVEPVPVRLDEVADSVLAELQPMILEKRQEVEKRFAAPIPPIPADRDMLRIVFQNLLGNAVKYTPERGRVSVSIEPDKDDVLVTVADTGVGIPREQQGQIFTKMFRAENVRKTDGTGLGLYVAKEIVGMAGGRIWFES
jgi:signal transduction histidine kinase